MNTQVVLITGALTGIGRAAAVVFAQEGARVVVSGRRDKEGQELAAELQALRAEAIFVRADVRNENDVRDLVDRTVARFGPAGCCCQLRWNGGQAWPGDGTDCRNLRCDVRYKRPGYAAQHEA